MKYYIIAILAFLLMIPIESKVEKDIIKPTIQEVPKAEITMSKDDSDYLAFMEEFPPFDFSTIEIEQHEGCTDYLVYPGRASGPTISCGLDLGNAGFKTVSEVLKYNVSDSIYDILIKATSIRGENSPGWIRKNQVKLGRKTAVKICNKLKMVIWRQLTNKYPNVESAPSQVKTAMLDIAFQAGVGSKRMSGFGAVIARKDWNSLGILIENSYNDFEGGKYHSIHRRRVAHGKQIQFIYNPPTNVVIDYD